MGWLGYVPYEIPQREVTTIDVLLMKTPTQRDVMTMDPDTLLLSIRGPETGVAPVLGSPCVVDVLRHSHAVGLRGHRTEPMHMAMRPATTVHAPFIPHAPSRPPPGTCARDTQQTPRPAPTPRGTNLGCGTRGTRGGGGEREGGKPRQDLGGVESTHEQP